MFQVPDWFHALTPQQMRELSRASTASVTSPMLNADGSPAPDVNLNPQQFAPREVADDLARRIGGNVVQERYDAFAPSAPQYGLQFAGKGSNGDTLNAGLVRDRYVLGQARGENPAYTNEAVASGAMNWAPGPRNTAFGVQPTSGAMTSADAERLYAGRPEFDPNMAVNRLPARGAVGSGGGGGLGSIGGSGIGAGSAGGGISSFGAASAGIPRPQITSSVGGAGSTGAGFGSVGGGSSRPPAVRPPAVRTPGTGSTAGNGAYIGAPARTAGVSAAPANSLYARARQRLGMAG